VHETLIYKTKVLLQMHLNMMNVTYTRMFVLSISTTWQHFTHSSIYRIALFDL